MHDGEEIKVNKRKNDKIYFESPLIQSVSDTIDYLRSESKEILKEIDSSQLTGHIDVEEFAEETISHITGIVDDLSEFKDEIINDEDIPSVVKDSSNDMKYALNRDDDYVRRAKRRLVSDDYENDLRIVRLCDKAIDVNRRNWEAYYLKGIALINLDKYEEAADMLIKSLALNEDNINARLYVANAYRLNEDYEDAIDAYDSVLKRDENSFDAYKGKAYTYYNWDKYDKADEFFQKANSIEFLDEKSKEIWEISKEKMV